MLCLQMGCTDHIPRHPDSMGWKDYNKVLKLKEKENIVQTDQTNYLPRKKDQLALNSPRTTQAHDLCPARGQCSCSERERATDGMEKSSGISKLPNEKIKLMMS